jgi:tRNA/rRNA methyltransferase
MFDVRIILVEPCGALNLGSVARVMKNMGLSQLWLVNPQCDRHSDQAQHMAVRAKDILDSAQSDRHRRSNITGHLKAPRSVTRVELVDCR